ncbi:unnamed protein product [Lathyrus sativus]|nr:unnamed protein product [Lathyrus sativus]
MLDESNVHAKACRMARDVLKESTFDDLKLKLISSRSGDGRVYNTPTISKVAALIVSDIDSTKLRDIIIHERDGGLQRIEEFHPTYLGYQYPLIFTYGEDGYRENILHRYKHEQTVTKQNHQTTKDWLCFRLQEHIVEPTNLLHARRLFQQFSVDNYSMIETECLNWLRRKQSKLRVGKYSNLQQQDGVGTSQQGNKQGKHVICLLHLSGEKGT